MPSIMSRSAKPITPSPIFLFASVISFILSNGNLFMVITLSRKCTAFFTVFSSLGQSISPLFTIFTRFMEPKLHDSYGRRGCSPHGFVLSISPSFGVGLSLFNLSKNTMPGSPFFHAISAILSKTFFALRLSTISLVRGFTRS